MVVDLHKRMRIATPACALVRNDRQEHLRAAVGKVQNAGFREADSLLYRGEAGSLDCGFAPYVPFSGQ